MRYVRGLVSPSHSEASSPDTLDEEANDWMRTVGCYAVVFNYRLTCSEVCMRRCAQWNGTPLTSTKNQAILFTATLKTKEQEPKKKTYLLPVSIFWRCFVAASGAPTPLCLFPDQQQNNNTNQELYYCLWSSAHSFYKRSPFRTCSRPDGPMQHHRIALRRMPSPYCMQTNISQALGLPAVA